MALIECGYDPKPLSNAGLIQSHLSACGEIRVWPRYLLGFKYQWEIPRNRDALSMALTT
jgi:hypothetical protein